MQKYLIKNIHIVNEGRIYLSDVLISNKRIEKIEPNISVNYHVAEIDGEGKYLLPGVIDDQVHFREPGLTHKATIYTESKAAVAGGVTSLWKCQTQCHQHLRKNCWKKNTVLLHKLRLPITRFIWVLLMIM